MKEERIAHGEVPEHKRDQLLPGRADQAGVRAPDNHQSIAEVQRRIKELLADKDRMEIDVRLVYGKSELAPREINWPRSLEFVRTSFCQNLHAKCYVNQQAAIITSMNL